jgi:hypothetical protein
MRKQAHPTGVQKMIVNLRVGKSLLLQGALVRTNVASAQRAERRPPLRHEMISSLSSKSRCRGPEGPNRPGRQTRGEPASSRRPGLVSKSIRPQFQRGLLPGRHDADPRRHLSRPRPVRITYSHGRVKLAFRGDTNFHSNACPEMSLAYQKGLSVETNWTEAPGCNYTRTANQHAGLLNWRRWRSRWPRAVSKRAEGWPNNSKPMADTLSGRTTQGGCTVEIGRPDGRGQNTACNYQPPNPCCGRNDFNSCRGRIR